MCYVCRDRHVVWEVFDRVFWICDEFYSSPIVTGIEDPICAHLAITGETVDMLPL